MNKLLLSLQNVMLWSLLLVLWTSCTDTALIDNSKEIEGRNWGYDNKVTFQVKIVDATVPYNLYLNLRHTADYKYSNIFILVHQSAKGIKKTTIRKEFQLAYPDGEWLGSGSGNLYSYQIPFRKNYKFPFPGVYTFQFEQNMRDNPLREINDVGIRVEPTSK